MLNGKILQKKAGETRLMFVSFSSKLNEDEFLSGDATIEEISHSPTSTLTLESATVTSQERSIAGFDVPAQEAVEFTVSGGTARTEYSVRITVGTDQEQALVEDIRIYVE